MNRTEIANYALGIVGAQRISSLDEPGPAAAKCKNLLPISESHVLRLHKWPSHTARSILPMVEPIPESAPATYAYVIPSNTRVIGIEPAGAYCIEKGILYTDNESCTLIYITPRADEYQDQLLAEAIALHLASRLAVDMSDDLQKQASIRQELQGVIMQAKILASDESSQEDNLREWWL